MELANLVGQEVIGESGKVYRDLCKFKERKDESDPKKIVIFRAKQGKENVIIKEVIGRSREFDFYKKLEEIGESHHTTLPLDDIIDIDGKQLLVFPFYSYNSLAKITLQDMINSRYYCDTEDSSLSSEKFIVRMGFTLANFVSFLNAHNMMHLDIKPDNVLLSRKNQNSCGYYPGIKVIDFEEVIFGEKDIPVGEEREIIIDTTNIRTGGTLGYMAPERFTMNPKITSKVDVYSIGLIMYDLMCFWNHRVLEVKKKRLLELQKELGYMGLNRAQFPEEHSVFDDNTFWESYGLKTADYRKQINPMWNRCIPERTGNIIAKCLEINPKRRYSAIQLADALQPIMMEHMLARRYS
jgi:serine/threonine protein kinase